MEPENPRPEDAMKTRTPETDESTYDPSTSASIKLEAEVEKELRTIFTFAAPEK